MSGHAGSVASKGSWENPLTEADMPHTVIEDAELWFFHEPDFLHKLPLAHAGERITLEVEFAIEPAAPLPPQ